MRRSGSLRSVVPAERFLHEEDSRRFRHVDLAAFDEAQLWSERRMVEQELARLIFRRARPRLLDPDQTDQDWLAARACRLRDELAKRSAARGRR
jgi:hypothetical protein